MKNLKQINKIRIIAQTIHNKNFEREYNNLISPLLNKIKIGGDDSISMDMPKFLNEIQKLSVSYQYIPDLNNMLKLKNLEDICNELIRGEK